MKINRGSGCSHSAAEHPAHEAASGAQRQAAFSHHFCQPNWPGWPRAGQSGRMHAGNYPNYWPPVCVTWWAGALAPKWRNFSAALPLPKRGRCCRGFGLQPDKQRTTAGQACWLLLRRGHSPSHSLNFRCTAQTNVTGQSRRCHPCSTSLKASIWGSRRCRQKKPGQGQKGCFRTPRQSSQVVTTTHGHASCRHT